MQSHSTMPYLNICLNWLLMKHSPWKCCCSVAKSSLTLCDPMDCCTPGFPVHHRLLELTQSHVHRVGDAIQPSHPPTFNLSQHQGLLFVTSLHQVGVSALAPVFPVNIQDWLSLGWTGWISKGDWLQSKRLSIAISNTTVQRHQCWCSAFFIIQLSSPHMTTRKTIT